MFNNSKANYVQFHITPSRDDEKEVHLEDSLTCFPCEPQQQIPSHPSDSSDRRASSANSPSGNLLSVATVDAGLKQRTPGQLCLFKSCTGPRKRLAPVSSHQCSHRAMDQEQAEVRGEERSSSQGEMAGSQGSTHNSKHTVSISSLSPQRYLSLSASPTGKHIRLNDVKQGFMM